MIELDYRDHRPIYEQIRDNMRKLILTGALKPGERLPSVRDLASQLAINPNTIQRAYRELENEGFAYTVSGKGSFAAHAQEVDHRRREALLEAFDACVFELRYLGESQEGLAKRIKEGFNK